MSETTKELPKQLDWTGIQQVKFAGLLEHMKLVVVNPTADWLIKNNLAPAGTEVNYVVDKTVEGQTALERTVYYDFWFKCQKGVHLVNEDKVKLYQDNTGATQDSDGVFTKDSPFDASNPTGPRCIPFSSQGRMIRHRIFMKPQKLMTTKTGLQLYVNAFGQMKDEAKNYLEENDLFNPNKLEQGKVRKLVDNEYNIILICRALLGLYPADEFNLTPTPEIKAQLLSGKYDFSRIISNAKEVVLRVAIKKDKRYQHIEKVSAYWNAKSEEFMVKGLRGTGDNGTSWDRITPNVWGRFGSPLIGELATFERKLSNEDQEAVDSVWDNAGAGYSSSSSAGSYTPPADGDDDLPF